MMWSFRRDSACIDLEVRRGSRPGHYELVVDYSDGTEKVVRCRSSRVLVRRTLGIQQRLLHEGWIPSRPAAIGGRQPKRRWSVYARGIHWAKRLGACFGF
jgi:hypothetical protein